MDEKLDALIFWFKIVFCKRQGLSQKNDIAYVNRIIEMHESLW